MSTPTKEPNIFQNIFQNVNQKIVIDSIKPVPKKEPGYDNTSQTTLKRVPGKQPIKMPRNRAQTPQIKSNNRLDNIIGNNRKDQIPKILIYLRIRENTQNEETADFGIQGNEIIVKPPSSSQSFQSFYEKRFTFSGIFDQGTKQEDMQNTVKPLLTSFTQGYGVLLFICGANGTGKTYTLLNTIKALYVLLNEQKRSDVIITMFKIGNEEVKKLYNESKITLEIFEKNFCRSGKGNPILNMKKEEKTSSHLIFTIKLASSKYGFTFVKLAEENTSKSILERCIKAITNNKVNTQMSFKDSNLIEFLKKQFIQNSRLKTAVIVNISPLVKDFDNSIHSLQIVTSAAEFNFRNKSESSEARAALNFDEEGETNNNNMENENDNLREKLLASFKSYQNYSSLQKSHTEPSFSEDSDLIMKKEIENKNNEINALEEEYKNKEEEISKLRKEKEEKEKKLQELCQKLNNFPKTKNELQKSIQLFQTYKYKLDEKNETDEKKLKDMHNKKINELKQQLEKLRNENNY